MIISVHELNEHDNLHSSDDFGFGRNFKGFLVISLVITGDKINLAHDTKTIQFYTEKNIYNCI